MESSTDKALSVLIGTVFGFVLLFGFVLMLYIAGRAVYTAGRMVASANRRQRSFEAEQRKLQSMSGRN